LEIFKENILAGKNILSTSNFEITNIYSSMDYKEIKEILKNNFNLEN
jgi:hypothetical protein